MLGFNKISRLLGCCGMIAAMTLCISFSSFAYDSGTADSGGGPGGIAVIYGAAALISLLLFIVYFSKKDSRKPSFTLLYVCVAIADMGYFLLAVSGSLQMALWANRISYFGCAFSVLLMLLIIAQVCDIKLGRSWLALFIAVSTAAFALAATGGWLKLYYLSVYIERVNGVTRLIKDYGPLHLLYPIYILCYFALMVGIILIARRMKKIRSAKYAFFLSVVVLGNIAVWGVEQLINIDFEFLSISFIATELLLLLMNFILNDYEAASMPQIQSQSDAQMEITAEMEQWFKDFSGRISSLTPSEKAILQLFVEGCSIEQVAEKNYISVNTVKKHRSNIYRKLEIHSREELDMLIDMFRRADRLEEILK